ncbi:MAG: vitamin K epoxide reductase family protein [Pyrobaculum sp.]
MGLVYLPTLLLTAAGVAAYMLAARDVALWLLAAAGVFHTLFQKPPSLCRKGGRCEVVLSSPYARPLGVPLEHLGALWFLGVVPARYLGLGAFWAVVGIVGVATLAAIEARLRALCLYCTVAHMVGLATAVVLLR